ELYPLSLHDALPILSPETKSDRQKVAPIVPASRVNSGWVMRSWDSCTVALLWSRCGTMCWTNQTSVGSLPWRGLASEVVQPVASTATSSHHPSRRRTHPPRAAVDQSASQHRRHAPNKRCVGTSQARLTR